MTMTLSTSGSRSPSPAFDALTLPVGVFRALQAVLHRRRWQRTRPFVHMNDHLRRDIGLPPLDGRDLYR